MWSLVNIVFVCNIRTPTILVHCYLRLMCCTHFVGFPPWGGLPAVNSYRYRYPWPQNLSFWGPKLRTLPHHSPYIVRWECCFHMSFPPNVPCASLKKWPWSFNVFQSINPCCFVFSWDWTTWRKETSRSTMANIQNTSSEVTLHLWFVLQKESYKQRLVDWLQVIHSCEARK